MQVCPHCGTELPNKAHFCRRCGYDLTTTIRVGGETKKEYSPSKHKCPDCGGALPTDAHFCRWCGYDLITTVKVGEEPKKDSFSSEEEQTIRPEKSRKKRGSKRWQAPLERSNPSHSVHRRWRKKNKTISLVMPDPIEEISHAVPQPLDSPEAERSPLDGSTTSFHPSTPTPAPEVSSKQSTPLRQVITSVFNLAADPEPEKPSEVGKVGKLEASTRGWFPILTLTSALGLLPVAYAFTAARQGATQVDIFLWSGLLIIFVPVALRLLSATASRGERIGLLCVVGLCLYLVRVMLSPLTFYAVDEFLHWRTVDDIARSGHLFGPNSVLPVSPFYPGLEIVTNALSTLSGMSAFPASFIVLGVARLLVVLSLFLFYEQITKSARIAGIASLIYTANPHFIFFDTTFAYGSLAVALAAFVLFALAFQETLIAWIALGALVVTHHVTDFLLDGLLVLWALTLVFQRPARLLRSSVVQTALLGILLSLAWINIKGNPVMDYLFSYLNGGVEGLGQVLLGTSGTRQLFYDYAGQQEPLWQRMTTISSVALIVASLPFGLLCIWQRYRSHKLICALGLASIFYPISQAFRLTNGGVEIADRAGAFLFIPMACVLAIFIAQFWPVRRLNWKRTPLLTGALTVLFLGGAILGAGSPWSYIPGPYLVVAGGRSIEPNGMQTAIWSRAYLGPDNRIGTDNINRILLNSYGDQILVTRLQDHLDVSTVFFSSKFGSYEQSVLRRAKVRYLVVDLRLSTALPRYGFYFEPGEPDDFHRTTPIDRKVLTKFDTIPGIKRVYDSGDIVIYDVGELTNASEKP